MPRTRRNPKSTPSRIAWVRLVRSILDEIEGWAAKRNWPVDRQAKLIDEPQIGRYETADLIIKSPRVRICVEPVGRMVHGADGRIDISAWPALSRMRLERHATAWRLVTDTGIPWPKPWSEKTFVELAELLAEAE